MINSAITIIKDTLSFLRVGAAPVNTPVAQLNLMKNINHLASKKFYVAATSFIALTVFYFASVVVLFLLPQHNEIIGGYVTIFTKTIEVLAIIIASYLGVQAVVDLKYGSTSHASFDSAVLLPEKDIAEETKKFETIYASDKSYAPISWTMKYEANPND